MLLDVKTKVIRSIAKRARREFSLFHIAPVAGHAGLKTTESALCKRFILFIKVNNFAKTESISIEKQINKQKC